MGWRSSAGWRRRCSGACSRSCPTIPGLRLAARYRPGSAETRIGGDWYDAIPLRGGKVGIAIGDVVGRGVQAAARMAHLQSALRAYALEALRPELVLERMNSFVLEGEKGGMVTLLYAIVDPDASTLQVATAGHPPPLVLRPDGGPTFAEAPAGSPLGVNRFPSYAESMATLDPWSTVLLYTDGLVEGPDLPLGEGLDGLRRHRRGLSARARGAVPGAARPRSTRGPAPAMTSPCWRSSSRLPARSSRLALPAKPSSLASMRRAVAQWLRLSGASEAEVYEMLVACGEACANAVAHAHSAISDSQFEVTRGARRAADPDHGSRQRQLAPPDRAGARAGPAVDAGADGRGEDRARLRGHDGDHAAPAPGGRRPMRDPPGAAQLRARSTASWSGGSRARSRASTPTSCAARWASGSPTTAPGWCSTSPRPRYLDSAGVELLFDLARRLRTHRQRLRLVVPAEAPMRRVLDLCDIEEVAPMDATVEAAVEVLREPGE